LRFFSERFGWFNLFIPGLGEVYAFWGIREIYTLRGAFEFRILEMRISQIQYWIGLGNKDPTLRSTVFFKVQMLLSFVFCYSYEFLHSSYCCLISARFGSV